MQQKMERQERRGIREEFVDVEEEAMEAVFEEGPDKVAEHETERGLGVRLEGHREDRAEREQRLHLDRGDGDAGELEERAQAEVRGDGEPDEGHDVPRRAREDLGGGTG